MSGDREKCVSAGCSGYVTKPVEIDLLVDPPTRAWSGRQDAGVAAPPGDELADALVQLSKKLEGELPDALGTIRLSVQRGELDCARRVAPRRCREGARSLPRHHGATKRPYSPRR